MVGKVIAVILIVGLSAFIVYEVFGIVRTLVKRSMKKKQDKKVVENTTDDNKHGESE